MKKGSLKSFFTFLLFIIVICNSVGVKTVYTVQSEESSEIPDEVLSYADRIYQDLAMSVDRSEELYDVSLGTVEHLELGKPFVIYDVNRKDTSSNIYYFPVIENETIVLELAVYPINGSYCASMSKGMADQLEKADYLNNDEMIFYYTRDAIFCETESDIHRMVRNDNPLTDIKEEELQNYNVFQELSYDEKKNIIDNEKKQIKTVQKTIEQWGEEKETANGFSQKDTYGVKLNMNNCTVSQYNYNTCWAASVATAVRYITGNRTVTATAVCDKMGIDYMTGGSISEKQTALRLYGINYTKLVYKQLSFDEVKVNITQQSPILISAFGNATGGGHSLTITGYTTYGAVKQIQVWNSATGEYQTTVYNESGSGFPMNGQSYIWKYSLSSK